MHGPKDLGADSTGRCFLFDSNARIWVDEVLSLGSIDQEGVLYKHNKATSERLELQTHLVAITVQYFDLPPLIVEGRVAKLKLFWVGVFALGREVRRLCLSCKTKQM